MGRGPLLESYARSIFSAMVALKMVSKYGDTQCQTTCKLRFFDTIALP